MCVYCSIVYVYAHMTAVLMLCNTVIVGEVEQIPLSPLRLTDGPFLVPADVAVRGEFMNLTSLCGGIVIAPTSDEMLMYCKTQHERLNQVQCENNLVNGCRVITDTMHV